MSCSTTPRLAVAPDTQLAPEARYGLFSAATVLEDMEPRAFNGVEYTTLFDPGLNLYPLSDCEPGQPPTNPPKDGQRSWGTATADPFAVYAAETCWPGGDTPTQARDRLRERLLRGERHTVEAAVDSGHAGATPYLRHPDTVLAAPDALPLELAVGVLEQHLAQAGTSGVIHAPRWSAPLMHALGVKPEGPRMRTLLGTPVAFGSGYSGAPPADMDDDGHLWLYATGPLTIRRSTIIEPATWDTGAFNPRTNSPFLLAERVYVVDWPCRTWAVATTVERPYTPPPPPGPSPSLTVTPASGTAPLDVEAVTGNWGNGPVALDWGDGTAPVQVDDGASALHTYTDAGEYTVTARSTSSTGTPATAQVQVQAPIPPPTGVGWEFSSATEGGVVWSWEGEPAPERFEVHYRTPPGEGAWSAPLVAQPADRSVTVQGLTPGAEYEASVVAVTAQGRSEPATGTGAAPHLPPELTVTPTTGTAPLEVEATVDNHGLGPVDLQWWEGAQPVQVEDGDTVTHTYQQPGTHVVTATSQLWQEATASQSVTISAP